MVFAGHAVFISLTFIVITLQYITYANSMYVKILWFYDLR